MAATRFDMINQATQIRIAKALEKLADKMEGRPDPLVSKLHTIILAIHKELDGVSWSPDTLGAIADVLNAHGFPVRSTEEVSQITPMPETHCKHGYALTRDCYRCGRGAE